VALALSRWVDVISARVFKHETVEELAKYATVPVINALSDAEHPIQAFADLMALEDHKGPLGNNLKLAYIGDGNNVLHALLLACAKMGVNLSAACPDGYLPDAKYVEMAKAAAAEAGATVEIVTDPKAAATDADALYTDVWTSMGQEEETDARRAIFAPYQINVELMSVAKPDAIAMHCLPAHCGEEISEEVYEKHRKVIMDQAENRMHTQKALIALMVGL
jgi:ornithine carbamoyltransferase